LRGYALGLAALYENKHGFQAPIRAQSGVFWGALLEESTAAEAGLEVMHETSERWDGEIEQDGSLGRTELMAALGLSQTLGKTTLLLSARFPFVRSIRTGEDAALLYRSPLTVMLGVGRKF
jgi:hypothetical protein